jgi:hypothetical protein
MKLEIALRCTIRGACEAEAQFSQLRHQHARQHQPPLRRDAEADGGQRGDPRPL